MMIEQRVPRPAAADPMGSPRPISEMTGLVLPWRAAPDELRLIATMLRRIARLRQRREYLARIEAAALNA